jgi:uncharacterized membrane protein YhaH (DUF805 family)
MACATLVVRRWGPVAGGWIVGLPLTSGPIAFFLALEHGPAFAARAALSTILGINAVAATVVTYALLARRWHWGATTATSVLAFFATAVALRNLEPSPIAAFACTLVVLVLSIAMLPTTTETAAPNRRVPAWDLPIRVAAAVAMVLIITALAESLGPRLSGLISPFPIFTLVMAVFSHRQSGGAVAVAYARGLLASLVGFAAFFVVVASALPALGLSTFFIATATALLTSGAAAFIVARSHR